MSGTESQSANELLKELAGQLDGAVRGSTAQAGHFGCALRAAVAKALEFTLSAWSEPPAADAFFSTATLRGICEDFIVLNFIARLNTEEQNRTVGLLMQVQLAEGLSAQRAFFEAQRPWQPVLPPTVLTVDQTQDDELRAISVKLGWTGRQAWPSVCFMAKECSEEALYRFLYSATSKWVHFSPHVLLRMGWGGGENDLSDETEWHFTTSHFHQYYVEFNRTYSLYLLDRLLRGPAKSLLSPEASVVIDQLRERLNDALRWPEAVTFEEMNLNAPGPLQRLLLRAAHVANSSASEGTKES